MNSTTRIFLAALCIVLIPACAGVDFVKPPAATNAMDKTMGSYSTQNADDLILVTMRNRVHDELTQSGDISSTETPLPAAYARFLLTLEARFGIRRVADWPLSSLNIRCLVFRIDNARQRDEIVAQLNQESLIDTAQPLQLFQTLSSSYNDPYAKVQHGFREMQAEVSHQWATGKGVDIAVIDTGLDTRHVDLSGRLLGSKNFVDRSDDGFKSDVHGTAVAAVIAATANNDAGIVGIAPDANILALKACWQEGDSYDAAYCNSFTLAKAINFAIGQDVDIINLSLAGPRDPLLESLVKTALRKNVLLVGAVHPTRAKQFPVSTKGVIGVAGNSRQFQHIGNVVRAPGLKILSAKPGDEYDFYSGSSLSTAHISGLAALIRQRKPHLSADVVHDLIKTTADETTGSANACRALAQLVGAANCPDVVTKSD